jgi:putative ABC transport system ATP-binding protein
MQAPVIEFKHVVKRYESGPPALGPVELSVYPGEAVAVLGPSGSGKSTLLNLVAALDRPTEGDVLVDGVRVDRLGEAAAAKHRRARIGMVFQFFNLIDDLSVLDNVLLPAQLAGLGRGEARDRALTLLGSLGVDGYAKHYPGRLSGGERQRVAVARALINRPPLLLADEPTGALDTASREDVKELMKELNAQGQTIVLVTHDEELAATSATREIRLLDGRVVSDRALSAVAR